MTLETTSESTSSDTLPVSTRIQAFHGATEKVGTEVGTESRLGPRWDDDACPRCIRACSTPASTIMVASEEGHGTTITITFTDRQERPASLPLWTTAEPSSG